MTDQAAQLCDAFDRLACPVDKESLLTDGAVLSCRHGHRYPIVQGVPVLLRPDVPHTIGIAEKSLALAWAWVEGQRDDALFVETIGVTARERDQIREASTRTDFKVDPVVSHLVAATNGILYEPLRGKLDRIPIPDIRLPTSEGETVLDVGCNWGRWSLAAAGKGWQPIGLDPSLGAVLAAKRLALARGLPFQGVVGDARHLPLADRSVDAVYSYSVLQHFSHPDALQAWRELARATRPDGLVRLQMASATGIRSFQHIAKRRFREPQSFDVRYWLPGRLLREFRLIFGSGQLEVDCYFGLGLQPTDYDLYGPFGRLLLATSEKLRRASSLVSPLKYAADSLFLVGRNRVDRTVP